MPPWDASQLIADMGRKRAPSVAARTDDGARAVGTPAKRSRLENYDRRTLERAFVGSEISFACIDTRATAAADCSLIVQARQADGSYAPIPNHPLRRLLIRPNSRMGESDLIRNWIASMDVAGISYAERLTSGAGGLVGLNPLNPASITPMDLGAGLVYRWQESGQAHIDFRPDELLIRRGDWTRPARMAVALSTIDGDSAQTDYVRSFFNNGGVPSGRIKVKGTLTTDQANGIRNRWRAMFSRQGRQHDVAVFDDNGDYEKIGSNLDELESQIVRGVSESRICMTFGVPPLIIYSYFGLSRSTYSNMAAAQTAFWDLTMSPLLKEWRAWLTWSLLAEFESVDRILNEDVRLFWDTSLVRALQPDEDAVQKRAELAFRSGGISRSEYRSTIGRDPDPTADDFYILPTGQIVNVGTLPTPPAPVVVAPAAPAPDAVPIKSNGHSKEAILAN